MAARVRRFADQLLLYATYQRSRDVRPTPSPGQQSPSPPGEGLGVRGSQGVEPGFSPAGAALKGGATLKMDTANRAAPLTRGAERR